MKTLKQIREGKLKLPAMGKDIVVHKGIHIGHVNQMSHGWQAKHLAGNVSSGWKTKKEAADELVRLHHHIMSGVDDDDPRRWAHNSSR